MDNKARQRGNEFFFFSGTFKLAYVVKQLSSILCIICDIHMLLISTHSVTSEYRVTTSIECPVS